MEKENEENEKDVAVTISSNTLFNFMTKYDFLIQALEKGLWPRYSVEPCWNGKHFAIPMLCFCDIPLSHIKKHIGEYGEYGIGITKDFARKHNLTPVVYVSPDSTMMSKIKYYVSSYNKPSGKREMDLNEYLLYFVKKTRGKNCGKKNQMFYDEREWRYIPDTTQDVHLEVFDDLDSAIAEKDKLSTKTSNMRIQLKPDDITYIFVSTDTDKKKLLKKIDNIYMDNADVADLMKTKILTCKQIREDF